MENDWTTRKSLILRVKESSKGQAWDDFIAFYERFIYHILHRMNISAGDINDLSQDILLKIWKNMKSYDFEKGRFRSWLSTVVRNTVYNYYASTKRKQQLQKTEMQYFDELRATSVDDLEKMVVDEWSKHLTSYAFERLKTVFSGKAVDVFSMSLEGHSNKDIAEKLDLALDSVYTLKNRVKARFIKEVRALILEYEGE